MTGSNRHWNQQLVNGLFSRYNVELMALSVCRTLLQTVFTGALCMFFFFFYNIYAIGTLWLWHLNKK